MKYGIFGTYRASTRGFVDLPDDKTWADVEGWWVLRDTLHVQFKGSEDEIEIKINSDIWDVDFRQPRDITVYPSDGNEKCNFDSAVGSF